MIIFSNGRAVDTDGLTEQEIAHMSLNDPKSWTKGRPPTDRELLDSKLRVATPADTLAIQKSALDNLVRRVNVLARQAEELRADILRLIP